MQQDHRKYHAFAFFFSAAFDTINHNILITCLASWSGIHGSALSWFKSYLSSRSFLEVEPELFLVLFRPGTTSTPFLLNVTTTSLSFTLLLVVFPKALFSARYFLSCTLPLSALSSRSFPLNTTFMQMTLSCYSPSTHSTLTHFHLQNALQQISSSMTANLLTIKKADIRATDETYGPDVLQVNGDEQWLSAVPGIASHISLNAPAPFVHQQYL